MARKEGLRPIGESVKKIIEKIQKERRERLKKGKPIRTQPKLPGLKKGGDVQKMMSGGFGIFSKKKGGGFKECGRKSASGSKRKYPKCVPAAKAARMTESQRRSAVARKRSKAQGVGGKPTNVATFAKKNQGGIIDSTKYRIL